MKKTSRIIGFSVLALLLVACGQQEGDENASTEVGAESASNEQLSTRRAEDRWQALIAWDIEKAYGYLSPGTRQTLPLSAYAKKNARGPAQYKRAVVKSTQCENQVCTLKLELHYIYLGSVAALQGQEMTSKITEKWIVADNNWFYVPD
jgi:hypothetical protein